MTVTYRANDTVPLLRLLQPWYAARSLSSHHELIRQLVKRDLLSRYRGSFLGIFWSLLRPLGMLAVYTFVFGFILQPRLTASSNQSNLDFVLSLFCGLVLFDFISECLNRAPMFVLAHPNYVKKVVFPLEILPVSAVGAALVQMAVGFVPLLGAQVMVHGGLPLSTAWLPVILLPLVLFALGLSWILSSLGVFIRDISAVMPVVTPILLFVSAVFYSLDQIPPEFRAFFFLNPIAVIIDEARTVLMTGTSPSLSCVAVTLIAGFSVASIGYAVFMSMKRAFADVM